MVRITVFLASLAVLLLAAGVYLHNDSARHPTAAEQDGAEARAALKDAAGEKVGTVKFEDDDDGVHVKVVIDAPLVTFAAGFHGFHVHANDDPANGTGCVAPSFASADGHFKEAGQNHATHSGDMPVLLVNADGSAEARFVTDRFSVADLAGKVVIVHFSADNYANIPARYSATGSDAATLNTGDAGGRFACGVID
jgi:Cu-Zn family superoxide dismutase